MLDTYFTDNEMNKLFGQSSWRGIDLDEDKAKDEKIEENEKEMSIMR